MTSLNEMLSIYVIKYPSDNQEVGHGVSDDPDLTVTLLTKAVSANIDAYQITVIQQFGIHELEISIHASLLS